MENLSYPSGNCNAVLSLAERRDIALKLCGDIEWQSEKKGFVTCPGESLHTGPTKRNHCFIAVDGAPTIHCFHSSCAGVVEAANYQLRSAIGRAGIESGVFSKYSAPTAETLLRLERKRQLTELRARAKTSLEVILRDYEWNPVDAWHESPITSEDMEQDWKLILSLFKPTDIVWIGDIYDSGKPEHSGCFRKAEEWNYFSIAPAQLTCPSAFKAGTFSRSNEAVVTRPFLVVESDALTKDQICSVFRWCTLFMRLRAIIDTGGKSLHGWFDFPEAQAMDELKVILPQLQCDPSLFKPSQPCRLPGAKRGDKWQSLIWFGGVK